jgi:methyl-accepting chemotaxis protein
LRERYDEIHATGVEVLAVAPGSLDQAEVFAAARGIPFPLLTDPQRAVYRAYGIESRLLSLGQRPALFAIDRNGVVRYAFLGTQQWQLGDVDDALAALASSPQLADPA